MTFDKTLSSFFLALCFTGLIVLSGSGCDDDGGSGSGSDGTGDSTPSSDLGGPRSDGQQPAADSVLPRQDSAPLDSTPLVDQVSSSDSAAHRDSAPKPDLPVADTRPPADADPPLPDFGGAPVENTVAAIQYASGRALSVTVGCAANPKPDLCAIKTLVVQARAAGASVVVGPEYALFPDQEGLEPNPPIGSNPGTNSAWPDDLFIKIFSKQAAQLDIYLVVNLLTYGGTDPNYKFYNSQIAFDPTGKVVGLHHKFELFGNETQNLDAGTDVMVFDTPLGKMGLLICADIYGSPALLNKLVNTLGARVVAFSSYWTVTGAVNWQEGFAQDYGVYLIAANTTDSPGQGGGIYDTNGDAIAQQLSTTPSVVVGQIPLP